MLFSLVAYLLGSIPSGILVAKAMGIEDPRSAGSGNIGAANLARIGGRKVGILTFLLDFLKGLLPVLAARLYWPEDPNPAYLAALFAVCGHCYSVFLNFHGGKGVATTVGVLLPLAPLPIAAAVFAWGISFYALKMSSFSAMVALGVLLSALLSVGTPPPLLLVATACCAIVIRRHKANLESLISGKERRF